MAIGFWFWASLLPPVGLLLRAALANPMIRTALSMPLAIVISVYESARDALTKPAYSTRFPPGKVKRVAVIGAGASGIAAAKEAIEAGFEVVVFEQTDAIGGNWVFRPQEGHSSVYRSTFINTSKQHMAYSDFPMPEEFPAFPHHKQLVGYFYDYARTFGVLDRVKLHTQVVSVEPKDGDRWAVTYRTSQDGRPLYMCKAEAVKDRAQVTEVFDAVLVCNGHHSDPRWPTPFPGQGNFKGHLIHSHQYKDASTGFDFRDKRIVVLGIGNSGVDVACDLSHSAKQVFLSTRSGAWIMPKMIGDMPVDHFFNLLAPRLFFTVRPRSWAGDSVTAELMESVIQKQNGDMSSYGLKPNFRVTEAHATISQDLLPRIVNGTVKVKPNIREIRADQVVYEDGSVTEVDAIVFATGYDISFPFLANQVLSVENNRVSLYKYVFSPNLPPTLAIVGLVQPLGALMPIAELQARWACQVWKGTIGLPSSAAMQKDIEKTQQELAKRFVSRPRHTIEIDFAAYMDDIASEIGAVPSFFRNFDVFRELWLGPVFPPQYRLNGLGAKPQIAREGMRQAYRQIIQKENAALDRREQIESGANATAPGKKKD